MKLGYAVMLNGAPLRTSSTSPFSKSAKLYQKPGTAKAVANACGGTVVEAFAEVSPE
ncbi:hypothetical protein KQX64_17820 [Rhodopseudomonas palustris]|nr:hypothetical protein KQX64_17820 [Rhodopseudomonas palustris]